MGILNLSPDSFYAGSRYLNDDVFISEVEKMLDCGASILDIGAMSTRPGSKAISEKEEISKLIPALTIIKQKFPDAIISVDTYRSSVSKIAVDNGADIINDISGGTMDKKMFETIAELDVPYVLMHIQGTPETMQINPVYNDVVKEILDFLVKRTKMLIQLGVKDIIVDPGFGFGKSLKDNYCLLHHLDRFIITETPLLVGLSRKSFINKVLNTSPEQALNGTTVLNTIALLKGADILRVHDVKEAVETIKLVNAYNLQI
jgi:dihydropteroate synthase